MLNLGRAEGAYVVDGVGLARGLVVPVADDSGEPECHAPRIARGRLHSVERDLDDLHRIDPDHPAVVIDLQLGEASPSASAASRRSDP